MADTTCCCCFPQRFGIILITLFMLFETLFILKFALDSTSRRETISFVNWGCFIAYMVSVFSLVRALLYDSKSNRKQACFSIVTATLVMLMLIGISIVWILIDVDSAYPYLKHKTDKQMQKQIVIMAYMLVTSTFTLFNTYFYIVTRGWASSDPGEEVQLV